ncbi:UDP-N-acetylmuramoyl-tripeptide--D-alanyl-D-alanine ligase [Gordonia sp. VNQ95]|uniref:UDP-N-acetylmuramoyl-tripeptide--D-alanyl-D- alanine ligase n=1 Tax=Gordonia TaxID=2053 RepID=UPI0032B38E77
MSEAITILAAPTSARTRDVARLLRTLVESADGARRVSRGAPPGVQPDRADAERTWAILGELRTDEADGPVRSANEHVVEHDLLGRLAVRLAVDKVLCVGASSRAVRGMHQGAVMEGSWGDEARLAEDVEDALDLVVAEQAWTPHAGDTVLLAVPELSPETVAQRWRDLGHEVTILAAQDDSDESDER